MNNEWEVFEITDFFVWHIRNGMYVQMNVFFLLVKLKWRVKSFVLQRLVTQVSLCYTRRSVFLLNFMIRRNRNLPMFSELEKRELSISIFWCFVMELCVFLWGKVKFPTSFAAKVLLCPLISIKDLFYILCVTVTAKIFHIPENCKQGSNAFFPSFGRNIHEVSPSFDKRSKWVKRRNLGNLLEDDVRESAHVFEDCWLYLELISPKNHSQFYFGYFKKFSFKSNSDSYPLCCRNFIDNYTRKGTFVPFYW